MDTLLIFQQEKNFKMNHSFCKIKSTIILFYMKGKMLLIFHLKENE